MNYETTKRIMDVAGATALLILFFPVIVATAIVIRLTSRGPAIVEKTNTHMKRLGKNGKLFRLYKFRSMMVEADKLLSTDPRYKEANKERHTKGNYKILNDPRVTKVGKFIRKYSIDEMPQFINVLRGEMSIVGPRAYLPDELEEQQKRYPGTEKYVKEMLEVKPGITGYWQVTGRSNVNFDKRIEMDAYYARKKSILFDILIILKTPWAMITGKGAT